MQTLFPILPNAKNQIGILFFHANFGSLERERRKGRVVLYLPPFSLFCMKSSRDPVAAFYLDLDKIQVEIEDPIVKEVRSTRELASQ